MSAQYHNIDLGQLALAPGAARRLDVEVEPGEFEFGGETYASSPASVPARLDVSRTVSGYALRLRFEAVLSGPCMRCLEAAEITIGVDAREVSQPASGDEELESPYVEGERLALAAWAHDALALALPAQLLCRADCRGLCPVCGGSLNDAQPGEHDHPRAVDPRLAKLGELLE
jgi:DUF177 domain-containing protein